MQTNHIASSLLDNAVAQHLASPHPWTTSGPVDSQLQAVQAMSGVPYAVLSFVVAEEYIYQMVGRIVSVHESLLPECQALEPLSRTYPDSKRRFPVRTRTAFGEWVTNYIRYSEFPFGTFPDRMRAFLRAALVAAELDPHMFDGLADGDRSIRRILAEMTSEHLSLAEQAQARAEAQAKRAAAAARAEEARKAAEAEAARAAARQARRAARAARAATA